MHSLECISLSKEPYLLAKGSLKRALSPCKGLSQKSPISLQRALSKEPYLLAKEPFFFHMRMSA